MVGLSQIRGRRRTNCGTITIVLLLTLSALIGATHSAQAQAHVTGRTLYDVQNNALTSGLIGVNDNQNSSGTNAQISQTGANCIREYWNTTPAWLGHGGNASGILPTIQNARTNKMFCIVSLWDATGQAFSSQSFQNCVNWWVSNAATLNQSKDNLIINIANEAGNSSESWLNTYRSAVTTLRNAGLHEPIMIDAPDYGRNGGVIYADSDHNGHPDCVDLVNADPDHNLIFSWHLYDPYNYGTGTQASIKSLIDQSVTNNVCFVIGEFSHIQFTWAVDAADRVEWQYAMQYAKSKNVGYLPWMWRGDTNDPMSLTTDALYGHWASYNVSGVGTVNWGYDCCIGQPYSIQQSATRTPWLNGTVSGGNTHGGTWATRLVATTSATWGNVAQTVNVAPNSNYTAGFWLKGTGKVGLRIYAGSWVTQIAGQQFTATSGWTYCTVTFNTGSNSQITFDLTDNGGIAGTLYFDDCFMGVAGGSNTLSNAGFESGYASWGVNNPPFTVMQNP